MKREESGIVLGKSLKPFDVLLFKTGHIAIVTEVSRGKEYGISWLGSDGGKSAWWGNGELIECGVVLKGNIFLFIAENVTHPFSGNKKYVKDILNFTD